MAQFSFSDFCPSFPLKLPSDVDFLHLVQYVGGANSATTDDEDDLDVLEAKYSFLLSSLVSGAVSFSSVSLLASEYRACPHKANVVEVSASRVEEVSKAVYSETFEVFSYSAYELEYGVVALLAPYLSNWHWTLEQLKGFVATVHSLYRGSPYHNWFHACDVVQFMSQALRLSSVKYLFSPVEVASTIVAGLTHDIDHDGVTNKGHMALNSERHRHSSGKATQEIHHLAIAQKLLSIGKLDKFLNNHIITELIEATDMATHNMHSNAFREAVKGLSPPSSTDKNCKTTNFYENEKDRLLLLIMIMKAADLSNTVRRTDTARMWGDRLGNEFHLAYLREKAAHVPDAKLSFHSDPSQGHDKLQLGFFRGVVYPFYTILHSCPLLQDFVQPLLKNASLSVEYFEIAAARDTAPTPTHDSEV